MDQSRTSPTRDAPRFAVSAPRHILAATDLSARSDRALARAAGLAAQHGAKLTVLHVIDAELPEAARANLATIARNNIRDTLGEAAASSTIDVREGEDYRDILAAATEHDADLLIVGRHRNEDGAKPLSGTTLDRVVRYGDLPVLLVAEAAHRPYGCVVAGLDLSDASSLALTTASGLAPGAKVYGVHGFEVAFAGFMSDARHVEEERVRHEAMIAEQMSHLPDGMEVTPHLISGSADRALRKAAAELSPDLIALGTHTRTGLVKALIGSVAESFLAHPPCDVLVTAGRKAGG